MAVLVVVLATATAGTTMACLQSVERLAQQNSHRCDRPESRSGRRGSSSRRRSRS